MIASEKGLNKLFNGLNLIPELDCNEKPSDFDIESWINNCYLKMNDDFNTPMLIAELFDCLSFINNVKKSSKNLNIIDKEKLESTFKIFLFDVLGLVDKPESNNAEDKISSELIGLLIKLRNQSRENKDFKLSDQIRDDLMNLGIQLNDDKKESSYKIIK